MRLLDVDGPLMKFLGTAFDFFVLFLLTVLLCIPIVTAGAALTSCMYVGMKIHRKEAPAVLSSYFRAFKENFKQSTLLWLIQILFFVFILFDWSIVIQIGFENIPVIYRVLLIIVSCIVVFYNLTIYAVAARFDMKMFQIMKTAFILTMTNFPFLFLVVLMFGITGFLCIWFFNLLPLFFVIGFTATTAFHSWIMKNACEKLIAKAVEYRGGGNDDENAETAETSGDNQES